MEIYDVKKSYKDDWLILVIPLHFLDVVELNIDVQERKFFLINIRYRC
jgi:hypothetical protein